MSPREHRTHPRSGAERRRETPLHTRSAARDGVGPRRSTPRGRTSRAAIGSSGSPARVAIEKQSAAPWAERALRETHHRPRSRRSSHSRASATIHFSRSSSPRSGGSTSRAWEPRAALAARDLSGRERRAPELQLALLRAWQLAFTRNGPAVGRVLRHGRREARAHFCTRIRSSNAELVALLIYLRLAARRREDGARC